MLLVRDTPGGRMGGIIVETEGYTGAGDPGSHACRGLRQRNAPMFGPPGHAYVYKCHMYPLLNVVTEPDGKPGAVLLRAIEPVAGLNLMRKRRPSARLDHELANGPGKLCQAYGVRLSDNRRDLRSGPLRIETPEHRRGFRIRRSTRIGLHGPAALLPRRFFANGNPCVSPHPDEGSGR